MREIKFRFRIKKKKGKQIGYIVLTIEDLLKSNILRDPEYIILSRDEYTGLKDKNGVEIYEGDVLLYPNGEKITVVWMGHPASFSPHSDTDNTVVIGNIYKGETNG